MIDKRVLELILTDQQEELEERADEALCHRREEVLVDTKSSQAQVIIGVRRSGKSTLCYQALHGKGLKFAYVDFDDERLVKLESDQLNDVLEILYKIYGDLDYLFLDEIQNVEGWHLFVNRILRKKMHVIITGSNAKLLSSDLATHLTGRNKEIALFPFSFKEFCIMKSVDTQRRTTKAEGFRRAAFDEYLKQGAFPELLSIEDKKSYVSSLVENILKRDIEQRYKITYKAAFENMAHHLLNVSPTVQEKVYAVDVAMMDQRENAFAGDNLGYRLETIVAIHLIRKCKIEGLDVYYLKDRSGECDFLVCKGNKVVQAIQVSYDISADKTRKREINGLLLAARQTKCDDLLLLTDHESGEIEQDGRKMKIQPVYEWATELEI